MDQLLSSLIPWLSIIAVVGTAAGLYRSYKMGFSGAAMASQDRVITAQKTQIDLLTEQLAALTVQVKRLQKEALATRYALKRQGLIITVEDDFISVYDVRKQRTMTTPTANIKIEEEDNGKDAS